MEVFPTDQDIERYLEIKRDQGFAPDEVELLMARYKKPRRAAKPKPEVTKTKSSK